MASPGLESFCCFLSNSTMISYVSSDRKFPLQVEANTFNSLCIASALLSICAAIYQLFPKNPRRAFHTATEFEAFKRQNLLICWLTLADLAASTGIFLRSLIWLIGYIPSADLQHSDKADFPHLFCAVSSGWIQYFYLCTYLWTFCYALDMALLVSEKDSMQWMYHIVSWVVSALLCAGGLVSLYHPSLLRCESDIRHLLPHYLVTYIPILLVMVANPVLLTKASSTVRANLMQSGHYTEQERKVVGKVKRKFFSVILVFYVCWSVNILHGVLLIFRRSIPRHYFVAVWTYNAVVNPLQAFLNLLVYGGVGGCNCHLQSYAPEEDSHVQAIGNHGIVEESTETSPLLQYRNPAVANS